MLFFTVTIIIAVVRYNVKSRKHVIEKQSIEALYQQQLLQSKIEIQEQAFKSISQELHDNIGQQLSLAKLNLGSLKEINNLQDKEKIETATELVGDSIFQIRSISKTLLGEKVSSIGLVEAIKLEVERMIKLGLFEIVLSATQSHIRLDNQREVILFRIVQEALNNVMKHSGASKVEIEIGVEKSVLKILIKDNGKGFKLDGENNTGIGLSNMQNRARTIGADLCVESTTDYGTLIGIVLKTTN